jgi:hypothetical protein
MSSLNPGLLPWHSDQAQQAHPSCTVLWHAYLCLQSHWHVDSIGCCACCCESCPALGLVTQGVVHCRTHTGRQSSRVESHLKQWLPATLLLAQPGPHNMVCKVMGVSRACCGTLSCWVTAECAAQCRHKRGSWTPGIAPPHLKCTAAAVAAVACCCCVLHYQQQVHPPLDSSRWMSTSSSLSSSFFTSVSSLQHSDRATQSTHGQHAFLV